MKIKLINFRKYDNIIFEFPASTMSYINGHNGAGKTTIFLAIQWVLYGKIKKIAPRRKPNSNVTVQLEIDDGTVITRTRKPANVQVQIPGHSMLESLSAQRWIESQFGQINTWLYTSFLGQDKMHLLMEQDPSTRMKVLNQIVFDGDDPTDTINALSIAIKEHDVQIPMLSNVQQSTYAQYQHVMSQYPNVQKDWIINDVEVRQLTSTLQQDQYQYSIQTLEHNKINEMLSKFNILENMVKRTISDLSLIPDNLELVRDQLVNDLEEYQKYNQLLHSHSTLSSQINKLTVNHSTDHSIPDYTNEQILQLTHDWNIYNTNYKLAQSINVKYDVDVIKEEILKLERNRDNQWMFASSIRVAQLSSNISQLSNTIIAQPLITLEDAQTQLIELESMSTLDKSLTDQRNQINKEYNDKFNLFTNQHNQSMNELVLKLSESKADIQKQLYVIKNDITSQINQLNERINQSNLSRMVQPCPHCSQSLKIVNNVIQSSTDSMFDSKLHDQMVIKLNDLNNQLSSKSLTDQMTQLNNDHNIEVNRLNNTLREYSSNIQSEMSKVISDIESVYYTKRNDILSKKKELENIISIHTRNNNTNKSIQELRDQLSQISQLDIPDDIQMLTPFQLSSNNNRISQLNRIVVVDIPSITVLLANQSHKWHQTQKQLESLKLQLDKLNLPSTPPNQPIGNLSLINSQIVKRSGLVTSLDGMNAELSNMGDKPDIKSLTDTMNQTSERIATNSKLLENHKIATLTQDTYNAAMGAHMQCKAVTDDLVRLREMRNIAINSQSIIHTNLVNNINNFLKCASVIFDEPINILVKTSRQNKLGVEISCVDLQISYQGDDDVDVNSLSGGERRKISALISLAFSGSFSSKLMILDESIACLDGNSRIRLVKLIKQILSDRIVLITCHEIQFGLFDNVIELS